MPRILVLCEFPSLNGGERSLLACLERISGADFQFAVAAPATGELSQALRDLGIKHAPFEVRGEHHVRREAPSLRQDLVELIERVRPAVLHANSVSMARLAGPLVRQLGLPSLGHLRDMLRLSRAALADVAENQRLLAVSHATREWFTAAGIAAEKIKVVYNGVDLERFRPRPATGFLHGELGLSNTAPLVGAIGQIGVRKGLDVLLESMRLVANAHPHAHLVIVGARYSGKQEAIEYEHQLHDMASKPPLAGRVHFLGVRNDVPELLGDHALSRGPAGAARPRTLGSRRQRSSCPGDRCGRHAGDFRNR